jgi:hypothetical protein
MADFSRRDHIRSDIKSSQLTGISIAEDTKDTQSNGRSWDSVVSIVTGYGLDDRGIGVQLLVGSRIFSSPCHPDRLWSPPNLLSNGYWGLFP